MTNNRLRDVLEGGAKAKQISDEQKAKRDETRARIRAKMSATDRDFIDKIRETFPGARLVGIKFSDGEQVGNI